jgi:hypothetical protein
MKKLLTISILLGLVLSACGDGRDAGSGGATGMGGMAGSGSMSPNTSRDNLPAVEGFFDGEKITFVHPEASHPEVAEALTKMMGSPVLVVPELAGVPDSSLAKVYVFKNGVKGGGPMGFQPDVFDSSPAKGFYSPLRRIHFVTWIAGEAKILESEAEIREAEAGGGVSVERTTFVVTCPFSHGPEALDRPVSA